MTEAVQALGDIGVQSALASRLAARPRAAKNDAQATAAAKDFEAMFMAQMVQPMFEGIEVNGLTGGGHGEEIMRGLMVQEYGKAIAKGNSSGLSDAIKSDILRLQAGKKAGGAL